MNRSTVYIYPLFAQQEAAMNWAWLQFAWCCDSDNELVWSEPLAWFGTAEECQRRMDQGRGVPNQGRRGDECPIYRLVQGEYGKLRDYVGMTPVWVAQHYGQHMHLVQELVGNVWRWSHASLHLGTYIDTGAVWSCS